MPVVCRLFSGMTGDWLKQKKEIDWGRMNDEDGKSAVLCPRIPVRNGYSVIVTQCHRNVRMLVLAGNTRSTSFKPWSSTVFRRVSICVILWSYEEKRTCMLVIRECAPQRNFRINFSVFKVFNNCTYLRAIARGIVYMYATFTCVLVKVAMTGTPKEIWTCKSCLCYLTACVVARLFRCGSSMVQDCVATRSCTN